jgi:FixJ family two-component response regulator
MPSSPHNVVSLVDHMRSAARAPETGSEDVAPAPPSGADPADPRVFVVDGDPLVRHGAKALIERAGWCAVGFDSAIGFLALGPPPGPSCLVLELTPPDLCGLEVQRRVADRTPEMPVVFITDRTQRSDIPMAVKAMKAGAVELLPKPLDPAAVLGAVAAALNASRIALARAAETDALRARYASLSGREREVMARVTAGLLNKQVGGELGISEITVKAHRGRVMRKMQARTLVDLMHMSAKLQPPAEPRSWKARFS